MGFYNSNLMKAEDAAVPRGDTEDAEVYRKPGEEDSICQLMDPEKVGFIPTRIFLNRICLVLTHFTRKYSQTHKTVE